MDVRSVSRRGDLHEPVRFRRRRRAPRALTRLPRGRAEGDIPYDAESVLPHPADTLSDVWTTPGAAASGYSASHTREAHEIFRRSPSIWEMSLLESTCDTLGFVRPIGGRSPEKTPS